MIEITLTPITWWVSIHSLAPVCAVDSDALYEIKV